MKNDKPEFEEYPRWLEKEHRVEITRREQEYFETVFGRMREDFEKSDFWTEFLNNLPNFHDQYLVRTGYPLLREFEPKLLAKPFQSFFLKTYRKNILQNKNWPEEPTDGWLLPSNWITRINDIIRTTVEVKYIDGVEFMIEKIEEYCNYRNIACETSLEAREEGYYAAHLYFIREFEIPSFLWDTETVEASVEIQITTQLQEAIRKLLHKYYEEARRKIREDADMMWQWDFRSEEFAANYLGHILHYIEGLIFEIREKQRQKEWIT